MDATPTPAADRRQTLAVLVAGLLGLALVAAMITRTSEAAFTASTDNTGNVFNGGTVTLTDDDEATALFSVVGMAPGDVVSGCILVSYDGTITTPSTVRVYSGGYQNVPGDETGSVGLSDHLSITIEEGSGAAFNDCGGFTADPGGPIVDAKTLTAFDTDASDYATGAGAWTPTATGDTKSYQVSVELLETTPDSEQGAATEDVAFVWEVQS
jgi:hypothetical protein